MDFEPIPHNLTFLHDLKLYEEEQPKKQKSTIHICFFSFLAE